MIGWIGSGKTTILRLITGLYAPETGLVAVDGMDVSQFDPTDLRANIGVVSQEVQLFVGTLEENICLAGPTDKDEAVQRAARIAGMDTIAEKHPLGYAIRSAHAVRRSPVGNVKRLRSPGRFCAIRPYCCSTSRLRRWTTPPKAACGRAWPT
jgi:ABC-type protease/lipase transport system fused ATPase/permease subunit